MTVDQVAARYKLRNGFRLADYAEVALPIYALNAQVLTLAHRRIPPTEEFVLKCLALNMSTVEQMENFLGLPGAVIKPALVNLAQTESIALTAPQGKQSWVLTAKGRATLNTAELISPEERTFPLQFDILTRKPVLYRYQKPLKYAELSREALKEIEAGPRRHPGLNEISPFAIEQILRATPGLMDQRRDVLAIRSLDNIKPLYIRAVSLIFRSVDGDDVQIGFIIDGKPSREHEIAFARTDEFHRIGMALAIDQDERAAVEELSAIPGGSQLSDELRLSTEKLETEIRTLEGEIHRTEPEDELKAIKARLEIAENELCRLRRDAAQVRNLYVADHPTLLEDALTNTKSRLMIISPWIKRNVVSELFVRRLENLLKSAVSVYIGYGIKEQPTEKANPAVSDLQSLADKYSNFVFSRLGNTHAKVLIKDSEFAAITSFNWLSFNGDPLKTFRDEQGTLLQMSHLVDQKFSELLGRFGAPRTP